MKIGRQDRNNNAFWSIDFSGSAASWNWVSLENKKVKIEKKYSKTYDDKSTLIMHYGR